ncbi:hypothetical protein HETIRDRAFT_313664, partial [Heterobasidion irregulare TC 32-1]
MADMDDECDSASAMSTTRRFKDPIHDYIPLAPEVCAVVDTKHFQRLRNIKQLGTSYYVWPGASHNRFEHCLGVAHLARLMTEHLQKSQPELDITDRDVRCVMLAGLCHDLGHGPWSHVWDSMFIPRALSVPAPARKKWKHEDASEMMFDDMIRQYDLGISEQDATFIKALIAGDKTRCADTLEKPFLFEIVANKRNGIDVDKFDYIARDSNAIGERGNLSLSRLIDSSRVVDNEICFDIKDANQVYELCYTRFSLHKRIYHHKTGTYPTKAIEFMIIDALLAADPYMKIAECIEQPSEYISLTDDIMPFIERTKDPELAESRAIFARIRERDLYKCVDYKVFEWGMHDLLQAEVTAAAIVREAKRLDAAAAAARAAQSKDIAALQARDVIVSLSQMHHGMGEDNPLDSVKFYSKRNLDRSQHAGRGDLSILMPASFGEVLLRVYTKDTRYFGIVQAGYRSIMQQLRDRAAAAAAALVADSVPPSPMIAATELELPLTPSTPPPPPPP